MRKLLFKNSFLSFVFLSFSVICFAQKQDRIWLFSDSSGIDFNDLLNPVAINSNITNPCLTSFASIADSNGQLLFYSAGVDLSFLSQRVYDKFGGLMENGDSLIGYPWVGQGSMIIPMPGDSVRYYLFTGVRQGAFGNLIHYSIIDMSANNGLGRVVSKNNLLIGDFVNEKLNATKHANGRDWWIVIMSTNTNQLFHKFLVTPSGIEGPYEQFIGSGDNLNKAFGQMIFSKDGSKIVVVSSNSIIDVFDFDRCTGDLFNFKSAGEPIFTLANRYFGCSISADGNVLYASSVQPEFKNVYQFDLTAANINSTKQAIFSYPDTGQISGISIGQHLLGPDDRIYIVKGTNFNGTNWDTYFTHHVDAIIYPNILGSGCSYTSNYFDLGSGKTTIGLPTMVNYNLGPVQGSICDSLSISVEEFAQDQKTIQFYPNPFTELLNVHCLFSLDISVKIFNSIGRLVYSEDISGSKAIDLSFLPQGTYIVEGLTSKIIVRKRFEKIK